MASWILKSKRSTKTLYATLVTISCLGTSRRFWPGWACTLKRWKNFIQTYKIIHRIDSVTQNEISTSLKVFMLLQSSSLPMPNIPRSATTAVMVRESWTNVGCYLNVQVHGIWKADHTCCSSTLMKVCRSTVTVTSGLMWEMTKTLFSLELSGKNATAWSSAIDDAFNDAAVA